MIVVSKWYASSALLSKNESFNKIVRYNSIIEEQRKRKNTLLADKSSNKVKFLKNVQLITNALS